MSKKNPLFFFFVFLFLSIGATEIWNFPKTGFNQIHPTSRQVIKSKLLASATFQKKFFDDFYDFAVKAIDDENISRFNDTELKYVFHFLENRWNSGNRFVIEMESVLYNCTSCQLYLQALKEYGKTKGKDINIIFKAHPEAKSIIKPKKM